MTGRERFMAAIHNQKPDHLPCQVHNWMDSYLESYMSGMDVWAAYEAVGMDPVIYVEPARIYSDADWANWQWKRTDLGVDKEGVSRWRIDVETPGGMLWEEFAANPFTQWVTKHMIEGEREFDLWDRYSPLPRKLEWAPVLAAKERLGDRGIVRSGCFDFGQGSPWQSFASMYGTVECIMDAVDKPDWMHHVLGRLLEKKLSVIERSGRVHLDVVELGGGAGSSTVISPAMHREFCLPYDQKQNQLFHSLGAKTVYHLCGGLMPLLEIVVENGSDGLETMTPASMGGDCDLAEATRRVGDKLFFTGGFDQNEGFEKGTPEAVRRQVFALHEACPDGGYICCPSDHFFFGDIENVKAFVDAAKECVYK